MRMLRRMVCGGWPNARKNARRIRSRSPKPVSALQYQLSGGPPTDTAVDAEVDLGMNGDAYLLAVRLNVSIPGIDGDTARTIVDAAHQTCPYSNATRGNINVDINIS